jgi:3',5'-cyclic-AMP phosphodiesterase
MFLLLQLSDPHIGGAWTGADPTASLSRVLDEVGRLRDRPDAVLLTGDLANSGADREYALLHSLMGELDLPVHVLPGNHDDRDLLREHFDLPGAAGTPVQYALDLGPLRLVALDTTRPGEVAGELDEQRLAWLESELAGAPDRATLLAMHHPPISTGIAAWDEIGMPDADRRALAAILARHPQVRRVAAGHVHQTIAGDLAGRSALTIPSTCVQAPLDFSSRQIELVPQPPGFAVHALVNGDIASHVRIVS